MKKITTDVGVFGPYNEVLVLDDGYRCDGADLPFTVVGDGVVSEWDGPLPEPYLPPLLVPQSVTMRQARLALLGAGLLDGVDAALAAIPDATQRRAAQIEWEYAATVERASAWVGNLSAALGLSSDQLDAMFVAAAGL